MLDYYRGFKEGMGCVDTYLNQCVNATVRSIIENETVGAKLFFKYLCDSRKFQSDYLHHSDCINLIGQDWNICTQNYREIIEIEVQKISDIKRKGDTIKNYIHFCWLVINFFYFTALTIFFNEKS